MSSWISASSSPNRNSASVLDSQVLPTPEGPAKMNDPPGRFGSFRPARVRRIARRQRLDGLVLADDPLVELVLHLEQPGGLLLGQLHDRDAGRHGEHLGDQLLVDLGDDVHVAGPPLLLALGLGQDQLLLLVAQARGGLEVLPVDRALLAAAHVGDLLVELAQVRRRGHPADAQPGAGLVDQVDRLVGQEPVGDVAVGQRRRGHQRLVGDRHPVVRLVAVAQALEHLDRVRDRRLVRPGSAGTGARARRPSRGACGTRRAWWRRSSAARRGPASA